MRRRSRRWSVIAVVAAVAVLVTVSGCSLDQPGGGSDPETFTVTLNKQGGAGGSNNVTATLGQPMPEATAPGKAGEVFGGYYTGLEGTGTQYYTAQMESARPWDLSADTELIAYWIYVGGRGPAGGIVFYDKGEYTDGWRYLEAAPASTEWDGKPWGGDGTEVGAAAQGTATGTGAANTQTIVDVLGEGDYAAKLCDDLSYGGYSDWFLPSAAELRLMYENLYSEDLGVFASAWYWSSSEYDGTLAWGLQFDIGFQTFGTKDSGGRVRGARAF